MSCLPGREPRLAVGRDGGRTVSSLPGRGPGLAVGGVEEEQCHVCLVVSLEKLLDGEEEEQRHVCLVESLE